jgi:hypothetical protein
MIPSLFAMPEVSEIDMLADGNGFTVMAWLAVCVQPFEVAVTV